MTGAPPLDERLFVSSVAKGMAILELFEDTPDLSLADIVARTALGRSAVQRFVHSLHLLGYLARDAGTKRYLLGPAILRLYRGYVGGRPMLQRIRQALTELGRRTRESAAWVELAGHEIIIVDSIPSPHLTSVMLAPGLRFEALSASSGQVLLAHTTPEAAAAALARSSAQARRRAGVEDVDGLRRLLARVRSRGYALTQKAFDQDSLSLSAPVFDVRGTAIGAVNLSALRARFDRQQALDILLPAVRDAARASCEMT